MIQHFLRDAVRAVPGVGTRQCTPTRPALNSQSCIFVAILLVNFTIYEVAHFIIFDVAGGESSMLSQGSVSWLMLSTNMHYC